MSSSVFLGYVDRTGDFAIAPLHRVADPFVGRLAFAAPHGTRRFGFLHRDGHWAVEPTLDWFGQWSAGDDRIATVNVGGERGERGIVGGRYGIVGGDGMLVAPRLEVVGTPTDTAVPFAEDGRWGVVGRTGEVLVPPRFEWLGGIQDDLAIACEGGRDGFVSLDGSWVLEARFEQVMSFSGGRGRVKTETGWVLVDREGRERGERYDEIWPFLDGLARARRGDRFLVIDREGVPVTDRAFDEVGAWSEGLATARDGDDWYFVDASGGVHGPYANALPCHQGLARFVHDGGVGFVRTDGSVAIEAKYQSAGGFVAGRASVKRDGRWTFVDTEGRELTEPTWDDAQTFPQDGTGLAVIRSGDRFGAVDLDCNVVIEPRFDTLGAFAAGLAPARRVRWPSRPAELPRVRLAPPEGFEHPVVAHLGPDAQLALYVCFRPSLDDAQLTSVHQVVFNWHQVVNAQVGGEAVVDGSPWVAAYGVSLGLTGLTDPARAARLLVEDLVAMGLPVLEVALLPKRADPDEPMQWQIMHQNVPAIPDPADPRGPLSFPDFASYWQAVWDLDAVPPRSENPMYLLAGRFDHQAGRLRYADRLLTLHVPGVRICYGVLQGGFTDTDDARSAEVTAALEASLARTFDPDRTWVFPGNRQWRPPVPMDRDWATRVETIEHEGRRGYYFAIDCASLLQDVGPTAYRYRENELMQAMGEVIGELGLAPVVLWQRFGDPLPEPSMAGVPHPMNPTFLLVELFED